MGLKLVSLEERSSRMPKRPSMVGENKYDGTGDPFKLLIEESLMQQRNEMMEKFTQILLRLPMVAIEAYSISNHFRGATPFKVKFNFDIPLFEGQIDANTLEKWLNLLEGYYSVQNVSHSEKITIVLLNLPNVRAWWECYWERYTMDESTLSRREPT